MLFINTISLCCYRAYKERLRLQRKRQASVMRLQSKLQVRTPAPHLAVLCLHGPSLNQSMVQISAASFHRAKADLLQERAKLTKYQEELQVLKRLRCGVQCNSFGFLYMCGFLACPMKCLMFLSKYRTTANATQCWTPAAVSKGFETFLAQAPIEASHLSY